jgi:hypothetical protein
LYRYNADLLAATRIQMMSESEIGDAGAALAAVAGAPVSPHNEAKVRAVGLSLTAVRVVTWNILAVIN